MGEILKAILCIIGVGIVAGALYFLYKKILIIIGGLIIIGSGILAYYFISETDVNWLLVIIGCGLLAGIFCIPSFLVNEIEEIKKSISEQSFAKDEDIIISEGVSSTLNIVGDKLSSSKTCSNCNLSSDISEESLVLCSFKNLRVSKTYSCAQWQPKP